MSKTFYEDDDLKVALTFPKGVPFVHVEFTNFTPSVVKKMHKVETSLIEAAKRGGIQALFAANPDQDPKWEKFMGLTRFKPLAKHEGKDIYFLETM